VELAMILVSTKRSIDRDVGTYFGS
jgi:hypothetical protein